MKRLINPQDESGAVRSISDSDYYQPAALSSSSLSNNNALDSSSYSSPGAFSDILNEPLDLDENKLIDLLKYDTKQPPISSSASENDVYKYDDDLSKQHQFFYQPAVKSSSDRDVVDSKIDSANNKDNSFGKVITKDSEKDDSNSNAHRFTTLLEDEEGTSSDSAKEASGAKEGPETAKTTTATYGTLITKEGGTESGAVTTTAAPNSMFSNMYKKFASFMPFLNQINILRGQAPDAGIAESNKTKAGAEKDDKKKIVESEVQNKKLEVDKKQAKAEQGLSGDQMEAQATTDNESSSTAEDDSKRSTSSVSIKPPSTVNNLRQSPSVVVPSRSNDELLGTSLLGKYIYAPEHHYHLTSSESLIPLTNDKKSTLRSYPRQHLMVSDDDMDLIDTADDSGTYSSSPYRFGTYRSSAIHRGEPVGMNQLASKTNDMYFLVMVSAFCVMAMAVVLAAGLFAYRVQQNRKLNTDSDYPTYGVVGPNNMSGKCNASTFIGGGYFANNLNGASPTSSKLGGAKHLTDLYSVSDSGLGNGPKGGRGSSTEQHSINSSSTNKSISSASSAATAAAGAAAVASSNYLANQDAARMYHYQHQKQQMIINDRASAGRHTSASDLDSEDENDDGSYTVYECPGLASAHEMEIKNPLFNDDQTP